MNIGAKIAKRRREISMTQEQLAEKLSLSPQAISRWENGERTPSAIALARICRELNASADEILELK